MPDVDENDHNNNNNNHNILKGFEDPTGKAGVAQADERMANDEESLVEVKGARFIPKSQVKKIILRAIVLLKPECRLDDFPRDTHHHAHVGGVRDDLKVLDNGGHAWGSLDVYKDNIGEICAVSESFDHCTMICKLQQIASGVEHLHILGRPHGNLVANCVFFSCDDRNHPVIFESQENDLSPPGNIEKIKEKDIKDLGRMFYLALTNGMTYDQDVGIRISDIKCGEYETAADLLEKMLIGPKPISIQEVLAHPLFWDADRKVKFIIDNFDSISHKKGDIQNLEDDAKQTVFDGGDWKERLKLTFQEKDNVKKHRDDGETVNKDKIFRLAGGAKTKKTKTVTFTVYYYDDENDKLIKLQGIEDKRWRKLGKEVMNDDTVSEHATTIRRHLSQLHKDLKEEQFHIFDRIVLVETKEDGGYDKDSFYDLLRFFRNRKAHYWESDSQTQLSFEAAGGYWRFFSSRFPKLLVFIYNHRESFPYYQNAPS